METDLKIWTVGHSTRDLADLLALLAANRIAAVADVRGLPGSKRFPQFNAESLRGYLEATGIEYLHIKELGGRRRPRANSPNTVWRNAAFRGYADYMETADFRDGVGILLRLARRRRTAIMCAEAVWWRCHRSMIADYLKSIGVIVEHIMGPQKNVLHPYTSAARIKGGELIYGAGRTSV